MATTKKKKTSKKKAPRKTSKELVEGVTKGIIDALQDVIDGKSEAPPWVRPWKSTGMGGLPFNGATKRPYHGGNIMLLFVSGYGDARWYSFDQAKQAAGYRRNPEWSSKADTFKGVKKWEWTGEGEDPHYGIRKGEKGTKILFWKSTKYKKTVTDNDGNESEEERNGMYARLHTVFNHEQCNMPVDPTVVVEEVEPSEAEAQLDIELDAMSDRLELKGGLHHGGDRAYYRPSEDTIQMPARTAFKSHGDYAATRAHECVHATGADHRLDRKFGKRFGDSAYAAEELVAEMGAAFVCATIGVDGQLQHTEYLASWIKVLKEDPYALLTAAREGEKAMNLLLGTAEAATKEAA